MAAQNFATINDEEVSWSDIKVAIAVNDGLTLDAADCEGIKWEAKVETGMSYGTNGGRPMKRTRGKVSFSASMSLSESGVLAVKTALAAVAPVVGNEVKVGLVSFSVVIQHSTISNPSQVYETTLTGSRYLSESQDNKEGSEALFREVTIDPLNITQTLDGRQMALI